MYNITIGLILAATAWSLRLGGPVHLPLRHSAFMDNLVEASNWYYGEGISQEDYRVKLMKKSLESDSILVLCSLN